MRNVVARARALFPQGPKTRIAPISKHAIFLIARFQVRPVRFPSSMTGQRSLLYGILLSPCMT